MSKLGRHERTIRLPDEEPWRVGPPEPAPETEQPIPEPAPAPDREREPVPVQR